MKIKKLLLCAILLASIANQAMDENPEELSWLSRAVLKIMPSKLIPFWPLESWQHEVIFKHALRIKYPQGMTQKELGEFIFYAIESSKDIKIAHKKLKLLKEFEKNFTVNCSVFDHQSALLYQFAYTAAHTGDMSKLDLLLRYGADPDFVSPGKISVIDDLARTCVQIEDGTLPGSIAACQQVIDRLVEQKIKLEQQRKGARELLKKSQAL